ncbi:restriction endonuclease [Halovenus marina]|uniref:restriction endonuclease n=1 Tax=Halovenus marina TaxID=3396621 RepID=UPI003F57C2AD
MPDAIDFTNGDANHDILSKTGSSGLLNRQYLADRPLETYLRDGEEPRYLLWNKQSGLSLTDAAGTRAIEPGDGYRALALCTDVRLLVVAGAPDGDEHESLPYVDAVEARAEDAGFRTQSLVVEMLDGGRWEFPFKGDVSTVVEYADRAIQTWANVTRLLTDAETNIEAATSHLDVGEHGTAAATLAGTGDIIEHAVDRAEALGERAGAEIGDRAEELRPEIERLERVIQARRARSQHANARHHWRDSEYEQAATAYETAVTAYEEAIDTIRGATVRDATGSDAGSDLDADGESLARGLRRALSERELLRVWPRVDANTARRRADQTDDPETAAQLWTEALDGYRDMLGLDWGQDTRSFVVDRARIREQTTAVADDAIEDHARAGQSWLDSGDDLAAAGRPEQATRVYERAREQYRRAHELASEVRPDRVDELERALETVDQRLTDTAGMEPASERVTEQGSEADASKAESSESDLNASDAAPGPDPDDAERSVLDRIRDRPEKETTADGTYQTDTTATVEAGGATAASSGRSPSPDETSASTQLGNAAEGAEGTQPTDLSLSTLRALDEDEFVEFVARVWEARGWLTTVFTTAAAVYDIVATRENPDEKLLIWAIPGDEAVGSTRIDRCATARESSNGADEAALVTTGSLTDAARTRASELDVTVLDGDEFVELLEFEGVRTEEILER